MPINRDPDSVFIRHATPGDVPAIAEVHRIAWGCAYSGLALGSALDALSVAEREAIWYGTLADKPRGVRLWVAERGGAVAGFVVTRPPRAAGYPPSAAEIYALYRSPDQAGTGLGNGLLTHALADRGSRGFTEAFLWVLASNERARRSYERGGWRTDGTVRADVYRGEALPHVFYSIDLT
jgi:ribosomal protein S18 acetylase RimI-like enzyme